MWNDNETPDVVVYNGNRDLPFKTLITNILKQGRLKSKYIKLLTNEKNMELYNQAFTSATADVTKNYEFFEQLGDVSANKFIVWYAYRRFPQLHCPTGVKVVARIRIKYGSRQSFATIGDQLGFWPFISATNEERLHKKKDLLEDCMESFVGCTEYILDKEFRPGVGYAIVYDILSSIFDKIHISLMYNDLYDAKTRIKELFDAYKHLGTLTYVDNRHDALVESKAFRVPERCNCKQPVKNKTGPGKRDFVLTPHKEWIFIGTGMASRKADAQQKAAAEGLKSINNKGYVKEVPDEYKYFIDVEEKRRRC